MELSEAVRDSWTTISPYLDHNWHIAQFSHELKGLAIVDPVFQSGREFSAIGRMAFSALGGINLSILCEFIGWRK